MNRAAPAARAPGSCSLSGSLVLSTGKCVLVRVELAYPALTRDEEREVEQVRIALHDLTPHALHVTKDHASVAPERVD